MEDLGRLQGVGILAPNPWRTGKIEIGLGVEDQFPSKQREVFSSILTPALWFQSKAKGPGRR